MPKPKVSFFDPKFRKVGFFTHLPYGLDEELDDEAYEREYQRVKSLENADSNENASNDDNTILDDVEKQQSTKTSEVQEVKITKWYPRAVLGAKRKAGGKNDLKRRFSKRRKNTLKAQKLEAENQALKKALEKAENEKTSLKIECKFCEKT